jgi:hypothetical protein
MEFFEGNACVDLFATVTSDDGVSCLDLAAFPPDVSLQLTQPAMCAAEDPGVSGGATAEDPVTFCCAL